MYHHSDKNIGFVISPSLPQKTSSMPWNTELTRRLGIRVPVVQGGMMYVGYAELASAVSNAGGLGIITALIFPTPADLRKEIQKCRKLTKNPFGVNITLLPSLNPPDYGAYAQAIIDEGINIVETAGNSPGPVIRKLKEAGCIVLHKCTTIRHAQSAVKLGVDFLSIDGFECAGPRAGPCLHCTLQVPSGRSACGLPHAHTSPRALAFLFCLVFFFSLPSEYRNGHDTSHVGESDITNFILLSRARQSLKVPFIASGGFADGQGLAAALCLGASGINMGTRFMCTVEAPIHENIKKEIVKASETDTALVLRRWTNTTRLYKNKVTEEALKVERESKTGEFAEIAPFVSGQRGRQVFINGDPDYGVWTAGQVIGLIHDIPTCKDLVERISVEAEGSLKEKLELVSPTPSKL
ncbi:hypothetical protein N8I77_011397 [Diaporthe amygdali]|uniref:Nitronate monooxygenase domain-containing protein n=1 Tax=Phomopsis amygdali TaxID=1214568 RepID=A0AAD9S892_PHOAM|nr:hypothetical protein N8I77_011397 [Diaporthe amygdali]